MSLEPNLESSKLLDASCPNDRLVGGNSTSPLRTEEDDDDDDIDFNPFQKESLSSESSSSLRSEVEGLDADVVDSNAGNPIARETGSSFKLSADHPLGNSEEREKETVMQAENKACDGMPEETVSKKRKRREGVLIPEPGSGTLQEKDNATSSGTDIVDDVTGEQTVANPPRNPILDLDNDDAICKRTRARYSLANFTLDELENFLQETDDDDDLPNIDEEEEYRKFLAAVLQGGDGDDAATFEGNDDDDDEDNDEDFDIEIEEAVASDVDDCMVPNQEHIERPSRGPQTRQSKLQKVDGRSKKKETGLGKGPLRPLFPILPRAPIGPSSETRYLTLERACLPSTAQQCLLNGFMPHQIGQLYSLIHEHVQLLVQVYSLCVLEPSRQHIASQMQGLLSELLHRRDQVLAWRNVPYPSLCFHLSYLSGSVSHENLICSPANIDGSSQTNDVQDSHWLPLIDGPVLSLLDVAPLKLVGRYMDDVSAAVREHWRRLVESSNTYFEKDSLFPSPTSPSAGLVNSDISRGAASVPPESDVSHASSRNHKPPRKTFAATLVESTKKQSVALVPEQIAELPSPTSPSAGLVNSDISRGAASVPPESDMSPASSQNHKPPRKTLAATLVESTKKQSVALVPEQIAELAQSFYSLFNPALFPHKPPPLPVANRVLFTDSEDELLALGMMEYNTDWKAIQQRFLPCKSKHQIFVRQKNQCSSKAPENPIKAVRKMKTSPLTPEEKARIHQALKLFKLDWMSIWKFVVPYRDPSLLPRQWRIAIGTQKSYKMDAAKREKRRLYEANRRRNKAVAMRSSQMMSEKEDNQTRNAGGQNDNGEDEDRADNDNEAYVHEAFLADWRPPSTGDVSIDTIRQQQNNHANPESQSENGSIVPRETNPPTYHYRFYQSYSASPSCHPSESTSKPFINEPFMRPYRARGASSSQLVRLAPDLPPVNLPPSARIISQATFMVAAGHPPNTVGGSSHVVMMQQTVEKLNANISTTHAVDIRSNTEEKESDSDLRMHPLLFQNPRSGRLPYYPLGNYSRIPTSFSFFPVSQSRINLAHFHNRHPALLAIPGSHRSLTAEEIDPMSSSLDFHPLLQRIEQLSTDLELSREGFSQPQITDSTTVAAAAAAAEVASRDSLSSPVGDGNELDLDIHLNSSSRKKMVLSKAVAGSNKEARFVTVADSVEGTNEVTHASGRYSGDTGAGGSTDKVDSCNPTVSLQSYDNEPPPGIVMEQEELSDSDEEIEHVEFECEEMEDSEGEEGSDAEHITNNRNKEQGDGTIGTSSHDQRNAPDTCGTSKGIGARKTRGSSLVSSNSPCDVADSSNAKVTAASTTAPSSPNRYRKKNKLRSKSVT